MLILLLPAISFGEGFTAPHGINNFSKAKRFTQNVYKGRQISFYCGCSYDNIQIEGKAKTAVNTSSCGYIPRKNEERGKYIEWEHVVPAHTFGSTRSCWKERLCHDKNGKPFKGRKCCQKIDSVFRAMEADLHNLQPAVGELNGDRRNYPFGIVSGNESQYGACDFKIDNKTVQPRQDILGDIARTYFYMEDRYGVPIRKDQRKLFEIWNAEDPVDSWEKERNERIFEIQGNKNRFVE